MSTNHNSPQKPHLAAIIFTVFLDLLGFGIVLPVTAPALLNPHLALLPADATFALRTAVLGFLLAAYPFAQFIGAPVLGGLADRYGRKKLLTVSLFGTLLGYVLFGIGLMLGNLPLLFASRLLDGFTGGNISIAMAAIADVSTKETRTKNFGLVGMAFGLGFVIGPYIGGKLSDTSVASFFTASTPFWFAAALCLINILLVAIRFKETLQESNRPKTPVSPLTGFRNLARAFRLPGLRTLFSVVALSTFGFTFFTQFFQVFLIERFQFTQGQIGDLFAYIGLWIAFTQGVLTRFVAKRVPPHKVLLFSMFLLTIAFLLLLLPETRLTLYAVLPLVALAQGLSNPNITTLISEQAGAESQGEILGINQSIQAFSQSLPPIIAGFAVAFHISTPIFAAAGCSFLAWAAFALFYRRAPASAQQFHEV